MYVENYSNQHSTVLVNHHTVCCMPQGVSGKVKERMEAAASGTGGGARPMLLFPEVTITS